MIAKQKQATSPPACCTLDISGAEQPIPQGFIDLYTQKKFFKPDVENETLS